MKFEILEKKHSQVAEEFLEQLELLPIFLNYYADVREKWLEEIGLSSKDIARISKVVDRYAEKKIEIEKERMPSTREDVIKIEDGILREMYVGKLIKLSKTAAYKSVSRKLIEELYPNCAIIDDEQLRKLESLEMFKEHKRRFPLNFLVFDPENFKIISIEIILEE